MILGNIMQMFEDILYEEDERAITGFINSSGDLEYSIYEYVDGGFIDLEDRDYDKEELSDLLVDELTFFLQYLSPTTAISGDNIKIYLNSKQYNTLLAVSNKLKELAESILEEKNMYVKSKKYDEYWKIVE